MLKLPYMDDFRAQVQTILDRGECLQLVSLPGMGVSRFAKNLGGLYLDTNSLPSPDNLTLLRLLANVAGIDNPPAESLELYQLISQKFTDAKNTLVIDSVDKLISQEFATFFRLLKSLRDTHKYSLSLLFINMGATPIPAIYAPIFGDLFGLITENILYFPPIPQSDLYPKILSDYSPNIKYTPSSEQIKEINKLSGGIPSLVKICLQAYRDNIKLDPTTHIRLQTQLGRLASALGPNPSTELLKRHGLSDVKGNFRSSLLQNFLDQNSPANLSAAETRLFELFTSNLGQIVSKDRICTVVYPDVKNQLGISDHAIDQLVHRLRDKISRDYQLITHRGLGYKLIPCDVLS